jgi:hypothetical protein
MITIFGDFRQFSEKMALKMLWSIFPPILSQYCQFFGQIILKIITLTPDEYVGMAF